jgi:hypothetical protein
VASWWSNWTFDQPRRSISLRASIVNAIRSLYRWAKDRELADFDPAQEIRLPASDAKPRDRVAAPAEFAKLIEAIFETTPAERKEEKTRDATRRAKTRCRLPKAGRLWPDLLREAAVGASWSVPASCSTSSWSSGPRTIPPRH